MGVDLNGFFVGSTPGVGLLYPCTINLVTPKEAIVSNASRGAKRKRTDYALSRVCWDYSVLNRARDSKRGTSRPLGGETRSASVRFTWWHER
jgi:hypothetical protein